MWYPHEDVRNQDRILAFCRCQKNSKSGSDIISANRVDQLLLGAAYLWGGDQRVAFEEARAILETYDDGYKVLEANGRLLLFEASAAATSKLAWRAAFTRYSGRVVGKLAIDGAESYLDCGDLDLQGFRVIDAGRLGFERRVGEWVLRSCGGSVNLNNPKTLLVCAPHHKDLIIFASQPIGEKGFWERKKSRVYFEISALQPQMARFMVNLAMAKEKELFLDPFGGSMSIPAEAASIGAYAIGGELDPTSLRGGFENMKRFFETGWDIFLADALHPPFANQTIWSIATDPPFGRLKKVLSGERSEEFFSKIILNAGDLLKRGGGISMLLPQWVLPEALPWDEAGIRVICTIPMRAHKSFTRYAVRGRRVERRGSRRSIVRGPNSA